MDVFKPLSNSMSNNFLMIFQCDIVDYILWTLFIFLAWFEIEI